jgi:hypothetical protein
VTVRRRRQAAVLSLLTGLAVAFAAAWTARLPGPPLYDGVVPTEPYLWLDPPPGHPGNPSRGAATIAVKGTSSPLVTLSDLGPTATTEPQAQLLIPPGALVMPQGTTSLTVTITPVEPSVPLTTGYIAGNVYRILITTQTGAPVTATNSSDSTVVLRAPDPTTPNATMVQLVNGTWIELNTQPEGAGAQFLATMTSFGDFALQLPGEAPSFLASGGPPETLPASPAVTPTEASPSATAEGGAGGPGIPTITIYAGIAIALVVLGLLASALLPARGRRRQSDRGWSSKPPPRTRR